MVVKSLSPVRVVAVTMRIFRVFLQSGDSQKSAPDTGEKYEERNDA
jgi:hypothetical protein